MKKSVTLVSHIQKKPYSKLSPTKNDFWFMPLGGSNEIGMNLNAFGHNGKWIVVDLGVTFHDQFGLEIITPDPTFLISQKESLKGIVITHAHEDHIGAIPYLWPYLQCPIYATPFTMAIIRQKLSDKPFKFDVPLIEIPLSSTFTIEDFEIEYISLTHSILEPNALRISTPIATVLHTGDWKIDPTPLVGEVTNHHRLCEIGQQGVDALICDSTNVFNEGSAGSELTVQEELEQLMQKYPEQRITVACFASNLARISTISKIAARLKRRVALVGRSLHRMVQAAKSVGYLDDLPPFITESEAIKLQDHEVCFIATGSQGEPRAALWRMATGSHPVVHLSDQDVVLFSSRMIPGNEKNISGLHNALIHQGVRVVTANEENIHVSGHPAREELKQMYDWIQPKVLIPVHGDARHLDEHARFGLECGIDTVVIPENGSLISLCKNPDEVQEIDYIDVKRWTQDGKSMVPFDAFHIQERKKLSLEGSVFITLILDSFDEMIQEPQISTQGLYYRDEDLQSFHNEVYLGFKDILTMNKNNEHDQLQKLTKLVQKIAFRIFFKKPLVKIHKMHAKY